MLKITFKPKDGIRSVIFTEEDRSGPLGRWDLAKYILTKQGRFEKDAIEKYEKCVDITRASGQSLT
jgi:hypothetical protein